MRIVAMGAPEAAGPRRTPRQPLVEILAVGHGHAAANLRSTATGIGQGLRYLGHAAGTSDGWLTLEITQHDEASGVRVTSLLRMPPDAAAVRAVTTVRNTGAGPLALQAVTSLAVGDPLGPRPPRELETLTGHNEWLGEGRWHTTPLAAQDGLPFLDLTAHQRQDARGAHAIVSHSTWSSGQRVPTGVLAVRAGGPAVAWQIEHNGAWRAEIGERLGDDASTEVVLALLGPTDLDHQWLTVLAPGEEFATVPVALAYAEDGWQRAVAEITAYRRALRRADPARLPVVFNDYMNTLMGDPTTEKLLPLIDAAAAAGADYFCIDAGWYDDDGDWWDSVGEWEPSTTRFPDGGLLAVVDHIRRAGMVPGLWLEPEVVGRRSAMAERLPDAAFLQRGGRRVTESGRYLLDLRHADAVKHLDQVIDRLVGDFGVGYFKFDYNVTPGAGTDHEADSAGAGLLAHNRAHLDWLDSVLRRHPHLLIENCASGGMRADYALLARLHLQSTSDQQNPLLYPPIAASAAMGLLPEQAANWAYPQPDMTDEEIVFTLCTGLAGRFYLSGRLDGMSAGQLSLVREAVAFARETAGHLATAVPRWPLGLPGWDDQWLASALSTPAQTLLTVWYRGEEADRLTLPLPPGEIEVAFPASPPRAWDLTRHPDGTVTLAAPGGPAARVLRITHPGA
ncbi:alpha-galactosidase [Allostreptomyces psammosilenae]|uniref:alpha-galactosidase n=1 Tax=Allostreptomyces psammosilenae TaxID=1892865 RepID=A0A852ZZ10_9ACTN|nr:alpha-galactosidase [Allostreptomyces psammosilenae]NYI03512.1 alpha-galactosidase [Allostreptomyces psammosilenae]